MNSPHSDDSTNKVSIGIPCAHSAGDTRDNGAGGREQKLPRRDWILLPLVGILTVCLLAASAELIARRVFPTSGVEMVNCIDRSNPGTGPRAIPNSVCWEKKAESQFVEYRFNSCGHRAGMECGPKAPGAYRIVLAGSSVALGGTVSREKTFAALLPPKLSQLTGSEIEVYNAARGWGFPPRFVALNFKDVLSANPDVILWVLTPIDIEDQTPDRVRDEKPAATEQDVPGLGQRLRLFMARWDRSRSGRLPNWNRSRTKEILTHYFYEMEYRGQYVESYLRRADTDSGFLKAQPSALWQDHLVQFDKYAADIENQAKGTGVPLAVLYVPNRAQAAMISMGKWPDGYDPYKLDNELRAIITRHGGIYIDILPGYRALPNPEEDYFPVDGHPNASGHAIISGMLAKALTNGSIPALKAATQPQAGLEKQK